MRVVTFNILHGRSPVDDRVDLDRYAAAIAALDADVLALQEVDRNQPRSEGADLTAVAAEAMGARDQRFVAALSGSPGATWTAATGEEQPDSAAYGIALLTRYPVRSWEVVRLAALPMRVPMRFSGSWWPELVRDEPRVALVATVDTPYGQVHVVNTHLSFLRGWNGRQLRSLRHSLQHHRGPLLLVGDLNMGPARAAALTRMRPLATGPTFPADDPREQLDHVLLAGDLGTHSAGSTHRTGLSDHRALAVDFS
jgi:endonuclease/exonuclease/phosphatase family metal-dependent hydrolase